MQTIINWILFSEQKPPEYINQYLIYDSIGTISTAEWYEGDDFKHCKDGIWIGDDGIQITDVIYWAVKPVLKQ